MAALPSRIIDFIFGFDYFIAYRWQDGASYARALKDALTQCGYTCFLDADDYEKGANWRVEGRRALRKSARLLLVGTPSVGDSVPVAEEVAYFRTHRGSSAIIPIDICLGLRVNPQLLEGNEQLTIREPSTDEPVVPSPEVIESIRRTFVLARQEQKRARYVLVTLLCLAGLSISLAVATAEARRNAAIARAEKDVAEEQRRIAEVKRGEAEDQLARKDAAIGAGTTCAELLKGSLCSYAKQAQDRKLLGYVRDGLRDYVRVASTEVGNPRRPLVAISELFAFECLRPEEWESRPAGSSEQ